MSEIYEMVSELLEDAVTDIFIDIQVEHGIECGDVEPLDEFELQKAQEILADKIVEILRKQSQ